MAIAYLLPDSSAGPLKYQYKNKKAIENIKIQ
jgi:hypothetical protein